MKKIIYVLLFTPLIIPAQDWIWARTSAVNAGNQSADQITTDVTGNVYVLGNNHGGSDFSTATLDAGIFLLKYDVNGNLLWGKNLPYSPSRIDADPAGNLYLGGNYTLNLITETDTFPSKGSHDIFLVKMDGNGVEQWARSYGNSESNLFFDLAADSKGNIAVGGGYQGDSIIFHNYSDTLSSLWYKYIVARISTDGITKWVTTGPAQTDTLTYHFASLIEINSSDNIVVIGKGGNCVSGAYCGANFLAKIDTTGNQYFHKWGGSTYYGGISEFKLDGSDNVYFISESRYTSNYSKTDENFNVLWTFPATQTYGCYGYNEFAVDPSGNSVLGGFLYYKNSSSAGCSPVKGEVIVNGYTCKVNYSVPNSGDIVLTTLNSSGKVTALSHAGGNNTEGVRDICIGNGACYVSGVFNMGAYTSYYTDTLVLGTHTLQNNNQYNQAFVAKMGNYLFTGTSALVVEESGTVIFPNPAERSIKIQGLNSVSEVRILDMFGKTVLAVAPRQNEPEVDISMLSGGVYIVELRSADSIKHLKILKE